MQRNNLKNTSNSLGISCKVSDIFRTGIIIYLLNICGAMGCQAETENDDVISQIQTPIYASRNGLWPSAPDGVTYIGVCWETGGYTTEKSWVRDAIERTWERESNLQFYGWRNCRSSSRGIRIRIQDKTPHTKGLGSQLNGKSEGMVLNFDFNNGVCEDTKGRSIPCTFPSGGRTRQDFVEYIAVHEFGHALGFAHEHNRRDTPSSCGEKPQGSNGNITFGDWDTDSVMNYCSTFWNNNGNLTNTDVAGLINFYGEPDCPDSIRPLNLPSGAKRTCVCSPEATQSGRVLGSYVYSEVSSLCRAAVHAGVISNNGGIITYETGPNGKLLTGSCQNGIPSKRGNWWRSTFSFVVSQTRFEMDIPHGGNLWENSFTTVVGGMCSYGWERQTAVVLETGHGECWFEGWFSSSPNLCFLNVGIKNSAMFLNGNCVIELIEECKSPSCLGPAVSCNFECSIDDDCFFNESCSPDGSCEPK